MAARMSLEDQIKFLLSCVRWSVNGKVDFDQVALECEVVTKGAAAKRYERMVKQYGSQGAVLENQAYGNKKSTACPKAPRKKKHADLTGTVKHNEDEERTVPPLKRSRNEVHHEMKQEEPLLPPTQHQPYMFHPGMPPQGHYMPRPLPPNTFSGLPYGMPSYLQAYPYRSQAPHIAHAPHPMFSGMHSNNQFMPNTHPQLQPFQYNQNMLPSAQEHPNHGVLDEIRKYDFGNGGYEALLNGNYIENERLLIDDLAANSKPLFQSPPNPPVDLHDLIKAEPRHASLSPFQSSGPDYATPASQQEPTTENQIPEAPAAVVPSINVPKLSRPEERGLPDETEQRHTATEATLVPKEEDMSCILICD